MTLKEFSEIFCDVDFFLFNSNNFSLTQQVSCPAVQYLFFYFGVCCQL